MSSEPIKPLPPSSPLADVPSFTDALVSMTAIIQAIIFGIVQGLTEFLPVSSSGHLEIAKVMFGYTPPARESMMMTVVLHFATALSTVVVFRKEVSEIFSGLIRPDEDREQLWFCLKILISMVPAAVVGLALEDQIERFFSGDLLLVGAMLLVTGVLLLLADQAKTTDKSVSIIGSIVIGISQAIAILPGISRSGATISTSVLLGVDREKAAKFSFLMVVPLIFGKVAKDLLDVFRGEVDLSAGTEILPLIFGFIAAFATGWLACLWMIKLVKACKLTYFSIYCFVVGTTIIFINW